MWRACTRSDGWEVVALFSSAALRSWRDEVGAERGSDLVCWWETALEPRGWVDIEAAEREEDASDLASLRGSSLSLGLRTDPKREERRDLKLGLALSLGSCGLC